MGTAHQAKARGLQGPDSTLGCWAGWDLWGVQGAGWTCSAGKVWGSWAGSCWGTTTAWIFHVLGAVGQRRAQPRAGGGLLEPPVPCTSPPKHIRATPLQTQGTGTGAGTSEMSLESSGCPSCGFCRSLCWRHGAEWPRSQEAPGLVSQHLLLPPCLHQHLPPCALPFHPTTCPTGWPRWPRDVHASDVLTLPPCPWTGFSSPPAPCFGSSACLSLQCSSVPLLGAREVALGRSLASPVCYYRIKLPFKAEPALSGLHTIREHRLFPEAPILFLCSLGATTLPAPGTERGAWVGGSEKVLGGFSSHPAGTESREGSP